MRSLRINQDNCTPRQIHSLWLLLKGRSELPTDKLECIGQEVFEVASAEDVHALLLLSALLGFTSLREGYLWTVTEEGHKFSRLKHWRFWQPPSHIECASFFLSSEEELENRPVVIDLFCGAGGFSLGFETAGFSVQWAIDNDSQACESFKANFPQCNVVQDDICKVIPTLSKETLYKLGVQPGKFWGIIGGPPCQSFTEIGERNSEDERSNLIHTFMEVVTKLEPDFFVMENVPGLASIGRNSTLTQILKRKAKSVGIPAMRIANSLPPVESGVTKDSLDCDRRRKRIVAEAIRDFHKHSHEENGNNDKPWKYKAEVSYRILHEVLKTHVVKQYHTDSASTALDSINSCTVELAEIAIAASIFQSADNSKDPEAILLALLNSNSSRPIKAATQSILNEYWSVNKSTVHKGVEIGPLLTKGIQIVSDKYEVSAPLFLNAANFGDPQNRLRLFLVGIHRKFDVRFTLEQSHNTATALITSSQALDDLPNVDSFTFLRHSDRLPYQYLKVPDNDFARSVRLENMVAADKSIPRAAWNPFVVNGCKITAHTPEVRQRYEDLSEGGYDQISRRAKLARNKPAPTIRAGTKPDKGSHTAARPIHYEHCRMTTVREGARLMGYPDWMTFHHTNWHGYLLVGNGIPRGLTTTIAMRLLGLLKTKANRERVKEIA